MQRELQNAELQEAKAEMEMEMEWESEAVDSQEPVSCQGREFSTFVGATGVS